MLNYIHSGAYETELTNVIDQAQQTLKQAINNNTQHKKLAIVFDIDETSLSNLHQIEALLKLNSDPGGSHNPKLLNTVADNFHDPAIKPTLNLYNYARKNNVTVFFITGRDDYDRAGTIKNLKAVGFTDWQQLSLRQPAQYDLPAETFKTAVRKKITQQGYDIVLNVGDQYSDLIGGHADNTIKLPDPFYYIS